MIYFFYFMKLGRNIIDESKKAAAPKQMIIIKQQIQKLLTRSLDSRLFSESQIDLCYQQLQQCIDFSPFLQVKTLKLQGNVIKSINLLSVPKCLTYLSLGANNIESLQMLPTLQLKELKTLKLYSNKLISIKPLIKCSWPRLQQIDLSDNDSIHDLQYIGQLHRNFNNNILTKVIVFSATDKLFKQKISRIQAKCHKKRLCIQINLQ